jgi:hypothetical protein
MADKKTVKDEAPPPHEAGQFAAVCVDVIDLGLNVETFQGQPPEIKDKTALVFRTENAEGEDKPRYIHQEFATSMGKKSNMRKFLESWRGKAYTDEESRKNGIPLDKLDGVGALITVAHKVSAKGNTYAVILSIAPLPKQMRDAMPAANGYKRPEFWDKRKASYRAAVEEFQNKAGVAADLKAQNATQEFGDYPEVSDVEDDDLPF